MYLKENSKNRSNLCILLRCNIFICLVFFFFLFSCHQAFYIQLLHLVIMGFGLLIFFILIPAAIFAVLEPSWNYLDGIYYCFISLTTIGLGDYIPGDSADQPNRALYKVATTCKFVLATTCMFVLVAFKDLNTQAHCGFWDFAVSKLVGRYKTDCVE